MKLPELKMICVCLTNGIDCDESGFVADVGNKTHLFCCQKGFETSLSEFTGYMGDERKNFTNN